jgi:HTH-type transcriptional regulator/antitoxin HigA
MEQEPQMRNVITEKNHRVALDAITGMMARDLNDIESLLFELLVEQVREYEGAAFLIPKADPVDCILFRMDQMGWAQKDVAHLFGGRSHTSEVLNRKRALTKNMIGRIHEFMGIPLEDLMESQKLAV